MRLSTLPYLQILLATASTQLVAFPFRPSLVFTTENTDRHQHQYQQQPLMAPSSSPPPSMMQPQMQQESVMLSDVMGRDRSMNAFAEFARQSEAVTRRLEDAARNSTVLAPLNSAIDKLERKPWEDPRDYAAFGEEDAYKGGDGQDRAQRNLRRFVEAHVVPASPWAEGERRCTLLDGDREVWWETRAEDGVRVVS